MPVKLQNDSSNSMNKSLWFYQIMAYDWINTHGTTVLEHRALGLVFW